MPPLRLAPRQRAGRALISPVAGGESSVRSTGCPGRPCGWSPDPLWPLPNHGGLVKAEATRTWGSSTARHRGGDRQPGALSPLNLSPEQAELFEARSRPRSEPSAISFAGGTALGAGTAPAKQPWAVLVGRPTAVVVVEVVGVEVRELDVQTAHQ